jgi:hypothetical protein
MLRKCGRSVPLASVGRNQCRLCFHVTPLSIPCRRNDRVDRMVPVWDLCTSSLEIPESCLQAAAPMRYHSLATCL